MRRVLYAAAALTVAATGVFGAGAARANDGDSSDAPLPPSLIGKVGSSTNDLLSLIPGMGGGEVRHICLIYDPLDYYYCVYIPLP